jgi:hypothetical protein
MPVTHPTGTLEATAAVAANAPKAIKPDANGEVSFRRFTEQFPLARTSPSGRTQPTAFSIAACSVAKLTNSHATPRTPQSRPSSLPEGHCLGSLLTE